MVARRAHNPKVTGSSPVPATNWSRGVAVNMPACHAGDRRFDPGRDRHMYCSEVAQLVEHPAVNRQVVGSSPTFGAIGPLVKRLRHRPFTAVTRVRFSYGSFISM